MNATKASNMSIPISERKSAPDKAIFVLSVLMIASFYVYETSSYGKYIMLGITVLVALLTASKNSWKLSIVLNPFHYFVGAFSIFCFASAVWAANSADAISKGVTIAEILVCISFFYLYFRDYGGIKELLKVIMWAGYAVMAYTVFYYGGSEIVRLLTTSSRLASTYSNSNAVGMIMMFSLIITVYFWLFEGFKPIRLLSIPELVMIAVSGSRKALVGTIIGIVLIYLYKLFSERRFASIFRMLLLLVAAVFLIRFLASQSVFSMVLHRMESIINVYTGAGFVDNSTLMRNYLKDIGLELFRTHAIGGIGMGNSHIYANMYASFDAYFHDNFVEILASGGIIGFALYYGMYAYVGYNLIKNKFLKHSDMVLIFIIMLVILVMDYGAVSYYSKSTYMFLALLFLSVREIRGRSRNGE